MILTVICMAMICLTILGSVRMVTYKPPVVEQYTTITLDTSDVKVCTSSMQIYQMCSYTDNTRWERFIEDEIKAHEDAERLN